ncbi:uncharacterized protein BKCO1_2000236 [Diplodia corticola]|uniref:Uncharacterized protein n=1 Tax=Diplodia corticola TaxID=236234 RepID=A0A1J9SH66_9PEZI|nr:uncharacterized protein BKCO1_2000236 [Diplodia corticola]OJD39719.1 hypothetical protein BKCO1_2000236 [Diplodia corticola]
MIPAHEVGARPSGYHLPVLLLPLLEFTWALSSDTHEFDPSAQQHISDGPHQKQLQEAFACVLGSNVPNHPVFPDLGYWRSELVARDLQNIVTSSSEDSDGSSDLHTPRSKKAMTRSEKDAKRPWDKFKREREFGEEFGHAKKMKLKAHTGKHAHHWFPDEDDNDAQPPAGYFERLKKEKQKLDKAREDPFLSMSEDEDSAGDGDTDGNVTSDSSSEDSEEDPEPNRAPCVRRPAAKRASVCSTATTSSEDVVHARSASSNRPTDSKSSSTKPDQAGTGNQLAIIQLCKAFDAARAKSHWVQAERATSQLMALAPWPDDSIILVAKVAFRVEPDPDLEGGFGYSLREAVAEHVSWNYERLRETKNSLVAMLLRDHEDLAEMVYERRLKALREKRIEVIEIIDDSS